MLALAQFQTRTVLQHKGSMGAAVSYFITHAEEADVILPDLIELGGDVDMTSGGHLRVFHYVIDCLNMMNA